MLRDNEGVDPQEAELYSHSASLAKRKAAASSSRMPNRIGPSDPAEAETTALAQSSISRRSRFPCWPSTASSIGQTKERTA